MADVKEIIRDSIRVKEAVLSTMSKDIKTVANMMAATIKKGGKIILFGNGGSAADAQHVAAELIGRFKLERQGLAALSLTTNTSIITSIANDYGYEEIFSRQLEGIAIDNDLAIGISTSGNARNVITGLIEAKKLGLKTTQRKDLKGLILGSNDRLVIDGKVSKNDVAALKAIVSAGKGSVLWMRPQSQAKEFFPEQILNYRLTVRSRQLKLFCKPSSKKAGQMKLAMKTKSY